MWNPLGEVSTTQGGGCQAAEVGDKGWKEEGGAGDRAAPVSVGDLGGRLGHLGRNTTAYVLLLWDLGWSISTFRF